jgi:hypothetical protein
MVAAEPQGALALTLGEALESMNENRMSLVCRKGDPKGAMTLMKATLMTYMDRNNVPKSMWKLLSVPKANGGFGLWFDGTWNVQTHRPVEVVTTDFRLKEGSIFHEFGSAKMTDNMLLDIAERHGVDIEVIKGERVRMIGDSALAGLGPTKFGTRRMKNIDNIIKTSGKMKLTPLKNFSLNGAGRTLALLTASTLLDLIRDPMKLRHSELYTPHEVAMRSISDQGLLNERIYSLVHGLKTETDLCRSLTSSCPNERAGRMIVSLWKKGEKVAVKFIKGRINCTFWKFDERVNTEVAALIQHYVVMSVAETELAIGLEVRKDFSVDLEWDIICSEVAREVWRTVRPALKKIAF